MKERKNLDRLFQEKFKDFEAHPSDQVWENIVLAKAIKKDRKVVPLWLRLGGIAAALAILMAVGSNFWNSPDIESQVVENEVPTQIEDSDANNTPGDTTSKNEIPEVVKHQQTQQLAGQLANEKTADPSNKDRLTQNALKGANSKKMSNSQQYAALKQPSTTTTESAPLENQQRYTETPSTSANTANNSTGIAISTPRNTNVKKTLEENESSLIIDPSQLNVKATSNNTQDAIAQQNDEASKTEEKKSLVEVAEALKNDAAEEAIIDVDENPNRNRWNVGAVAAPVYYGDFGGSGIDPQFKDNAKSGDVNLSYGVQVSYAVSKKLKVRTGVNNVDLSYGTNDISFSPDIAANRLAGVKYNSNGKFLSVTDRVSPQELAQSDFQGGGSNVSDGSINQRIGYIEVPVEAVYVISDKRLGVEVIGGVSTLFVNDNEIAIESGGLRTPIGASSSLNDVSFTTNVGVGLNYKVTESVLINLEPSLKYQLNAFDNSAGDFKPYYVGIYTGVSYRF
tara:strand:- start:861 stop:2387 length:1527 start_codon:yes stop_codon:yes gene_type:complete